MSPELVGIYIALGSLFVLEGLTHARVQILSNMVKIIGERVFGEKIE